MTEEQVNSTPPAGKTPETPPPPTNESPAAPSWTELIANVPVEDLRKHPHIAGIIGSEMQRAREQAQRDLEERTHREAAEKAEQDLLKLAREDPEGFADRYVSDHERKKITQQVESARFDARQAIAKAVGASVTSLPEWAELTREEYQSLVESVQNKSEDEAIPAYNQTVLNILAERRANKRLAEWRERELAKEREAIRAELKAQSAAQRPAPSVRSGATSSGQVDIDSMSDKDFQVWYDRNIRRR